MSYKILDKDPWLNPFKRDIDLRMQHYKELRDKITVNGQSLRKNVNGHLYYGLHPTDKGWFYREWAPAADSLYLIGDFNHWDRTSHPLRKLEGGDWEIFIPGRESLGHLSKIKVQVTTDGKARDRIPLYARNVVQDAKSLDFSEQIWNPKKTFEWTDADFEINKEEPILIYESHIGIAQEYDACGTYKQFTKNILPWIKASGYNTIQLMAIMQHPYYASFGYQVANFFSISTWFGNPDDLKELINTAHEMGMAVLLDVVHSHAIKNYNEGINAFDGTREQFFHLGARGEHEAWKTMLFNYGKPEVAHFLLSNLKFWMEEYHFDGFRFDGVTSMIYTHHGLGVNFTDYSKYFSMATDLDATAYLQLANELIHEIKPNAITIAEDMSGMPGMCLPIEEGGIGFDYRLSMGIPDLWIRYIKERSDEEWNMHELWCELTNHRVGEKTVAYAESHDQALVGDKTLMFWLADKEMYWYMNTYTNHMTIDRAMSLHKLIRLITITLGGEGYLNFMGNEFGHPEWIDFPREGNGWSWQYARRQWSLVHDSNLKYRYLSLFDKAMLKFVKAYRVLQNNKAQQLYINELKKIIAFSKDELIYLFNFHPTWSQEDFFLPLENQDKKYQVILSTDDLEFGGLNRISKEVVYKTVDQHGRIGIKIYTPCRTAMILEQC